MRRPLLVGQAPGPNTDPREPLSGRCGRRLADLCGVTLEEFLARFERVNLLDAFPGKLGKGDAFPLPEARRAALRLSATFSCRLVVLLGANVARAFELGHLRPAGVFEPMWGGDLAVVPHPSGVSRWWNDPRNLAEARAFWRAMAR